MSYIALSFKIARMCIVSYAEMVELGVADDLSFAEMLGVTTLAVAEREGLDPDYLTELVASAVAIEWEKISPGEPTNARVRDTKKCGDLEPRDIFLLQGEAFIVSGVDSRHVGKGMYNAIIHCYADEELTDCRRLELSAEQAVVIVGWHS